MNMVMIFKMIVIKPLTINIFTKERNNSFCYTNKVTDLSLEHNRQELNTSHKSE